MSEDKISEIKVGSVVKSVSGRDRKRVFIVTELDENNKISPIVISNGELRTLSHKKHKNPLHLKAIGEISEDEKKALLINKEDCFVARLCQKYDI